MKPCSPLSRWARAILLIVSLAVSVGAATAWAEAPSPPASAAASVTVSTTAEIRQRLATARAGDVVLIASGEHAGFSLSGVRGEPESPIVLRAADPKQPPVFISGIHLSSVANLVLEDLTIAGAPANGLNIDDGGDFASPSQHVVLRRIVVRDCGGRANHDGIKLSGVEDFVLESCTVERWGRGGSAVDMVGCHRGRLEGCTFRDTPSDLASSGVQVKGGSSAVTIRACRFEHAGQRAVNLGGSTGLAFFRPPISADAARHSRSEARDIVVEECVFIGSLAPIAFVGVDGAVVRRNTIWRPQGWILRVLQETQDQRFAPCRNGVFAENLVVYRLGDLRSPVNVGLGTAVETFRVERNYWYAEDAPQRSVPQLPVAEVDGRGGADPLFEDAEGGDLRLHEGSPVRGAGVSRG